jgi:hypothetical protein
MPTQIDKVIVTNVSALNKKYGAAGVAAIRAAIDVLIAADKQRGLMSSLVALDDSATMKKLSAARVSSSKNPKQNKKAIDAIYKALAPDYILILGATDVIPHQDLKNPVYDPSPDGDPDKIAYGDIPYACEAPYSQKPQDFFGATRVVGRLPDVTHGKDSAYLVGLLKTAAAYSTGVDTDYQNYLGITAQIWEKSTQLSLTHTFGNDADLKPVPPNNDQWPLALIGRLSHFINCHGADTSAQFYGQPQSGVASYPTALDAAYVHGKIKEGTIAAAECCYGGQLYDPALLGGQQGMCNAYLAEKAYGFFASTTIAYGPSDSNAQADLLCQYFFQSLLKGASLGRATLEARQNFVRTASPPDPSDVKTLAQFNLYGDPSITPLKMPSPKLAVAPKSVEPAAHVAERVARFDRRASLFQSGQMLTETEPQAHPTTKKPPRAVVAQLQDKARELGIEPGRTLSFEIRRPPAASKVMPKSLRAKRAVPGRFHVMFGRSEKAQTRQEKVVQIVALVGKEIGGEVVSVSRIVSR